MKRDHGKDWIRNFSEERLRLTLLVLSNDGARSIFEPACADQMEAGGSWRGLDAGLTWWEEGAVTARLRASSSPSKLSESCLRWGACESVSVHLMRSYYVPGPVQTGKMLGSAAQSPRRPGAHRW